jgi:hypothetical protein
MARVLPFFLSSVQQLTFELNDVSVAQCWSILPICPFEIKEKFLPSTLMILLQHPDLYHHNSY